MADLDKQEPTDRERLARRAEGDRAEAIVRRYGHRLHALARARLGAALARRVDPEDVVASAWRSFFLAIREQQLTAPEGGDLWPLLATLVARKVTKQAALHRAARRDVARESGVDPATLGPRGRAARVEENVIVAEQLERLQAGFAERDREVIRLRLEGYEQAEIAARLGCSERTVRRVLHRLYGAWREQAGPRRVAYNDVVLDEFIASGGFAKVYRAHRRDGGEPVAVKFLRRPYWSNQAAVGSILAEARVAADLNHPHLVKHLGWGTTRQGGLFLVMDWVEGETAARWFAQPRPLAEVLRCGREVASALAAMHAAGIVHGDLSPANVLRRRDGSFVLVDFGFARSLRGNPAARPGGTPGFLAPEQLAGLSLDQRTDLYGLGALLTYLHTGQKYVGEVDPSLPRVVADCLNQDRDRRPASANVVANALARAFLRCDDFLQ